MVGRLTYVHIEQTHQLPTDHDTRRLERGITLRTVKTRRTDAVISHVVGRRANRSGKAEISGIAFAGRSVKAI